MGRKKAPGDAHSNELEFMRKYIYSFTLLILFASAIESYGLTKVPVAKVDLPDYDFIDYAYNKIQIPGKDSIRIKRFYRKIDYLLKKGKGEINILHIGGSHVQADVFSNEVRRDLDAINDRFQTPRGFIFPYSVAKTNNPSNYKVSYTGKWEAVRNVQANREISLGMGGIAVYTSDPEASISVSLNGNTSSGRWNFNRLRLLGYTEDGSEQVKPVLYDNEHLIAAHYDVSTNTYLFDLPALTDSFRVGFIQEDTVPHTFIVTGFIPEKDVPGIRYHSIGVNGASVSSYLSHEFLEDELPLISPDLVIFGIGINDAAGKDFSAESFIYHYDLLIDRIERINPDCAFLFITNNDSFKRITRRKYKVNLNGLIAKEAFYTLAKRHQGGVWDQFSIMGGLRSMQVWQINGLAQADKVHFTKAGYELLGDLLYNALIDFYLQNNIE
jgi:lysophospholipase L1-like esterase